MGNSGSKEMSVSNLQEIKVESAKIIAHVNERVQIFYCMNCDNP